MSTIVYILLFTFIATILSLFLVSILLLKEKVIHKLSFSLVAFAAGALLATAFLDTLKEALEMGEGKPILLWVLLSIAGFFLLERLFLSIHHHDDNEHDENKLRLPTPLLLFGDGLHNFIDGASIAASFLVSPALGIVTSLTVFVHEIPHELGDFGILLHKGWGRGKVLWFNVITGLTSVAGALLAYYLGNTFNGMVPFLLALTTGNFIYLSMTDLLPEIHHSAKGQGVKHSIYFLLGIVFVSFLITLLG